MSFARRWIGYVNNMPLRRKMIFIILFLNFLFGFLMSFLGLRVVVRSNRDLLYQTMHTALKYAGVELKANMDRYERVSAGITTDQEIQTQLAQLKEHPQSIAVRSLAFRSINSRLQEYLAYFTVSDVDFISIESQGMIFSTNSYRSLKINQASADDFARKVSDENGYPCWQMDAQGVLRLGREIRQAFPLTLDDLGSVIIGLRMKEVVERCINYTTAFSQQQYFLLESNRIIYSHMQEQEQFRQVAEWVKTDDYSLVDVNGTTYFAIRSAIEDTPWEYISMVSYEQTERVIRQSYLWYMLIMLLILALNVWLCNVFMDQILRHVNSLVEKMKRFAKNNARIETGGYDYAQRKDELGLLHQNFDAMAEEIHQLIQNDYTNQILLKDAQMKELEAQVNPHFLYNVMNCINWRAKQIGEKQISDMVEALSLMMRYRLEASDSLCSLRDELDMVRSYVLIQKIRFGDQLDVRVAIPPELEDAKLPRLSLQPLVENAIMYSRAESIEVSRVALSARLEGNDLHISIANSGSSFPDNLLEDLRAGIIQPHGMGVGILNIHKRLELMFGRGYGLYFSNIDGMAVVELFIPYVPVNKGDVTKAG